MDYDILILGGGILGCASAYELSKYNYNIALIEKEYDIAVDDGLISWDLSYDGLETKDILVSELEYEGNGLLAEDCKRFKVPNVKINSLICAFNSQEENSLNLIKKRAEERNIVTSKLSRQEGLKIDPGLEKKFSKELTKVLQKKDTIRFVPYQLALAYGEVAFDNGVKFKLEETVLKIESISEGYSVTTNKNRFTCKFVLDATEDKKSLGQNENLIFKLKTRDEKGLNNIIYEFYPQGVDKIAEINFMDESNIGEGYLKIGGEHYGIFTMAPALAKCACKKILLKLKRSRKKNFNDKRREIYRFRDLSLEQRKSVIRINPKYGNVICQCKKVTEGEVVDAIRRPMGARTIQGIRKRTGAISGMCQGSNCLSKVMNILARETNKDMLDIVNDYKESKILRSRIKEFNSM